MAQVLVERPSGAIALVRLNRPEVRNALNLTIRQEMAAIFRDLADDTSLRCVVLTGNEQAFAAGADIADMSRIDAIEMYHRHTERLWAAVGECPVPVIAAVNGFALGGGLELAMHADIIVAGKSAQLGQPEVKVGIMPGAGGTQRLTRAVGKFRAMLMCLTGEIISAQEAFEMGLISRLVEDDAVLDTALKLAERIAALPPIAVAQIKEVILAGADAPLSTALALERKAVQVLFASRDKAEGMNAFLEKRKPTYTGE
ncbi:enoyl-CoA hydratase/carnithine racemase [Devosia subaequoris]|uniref:Enoyl-CoA hydratase/carnithine racemase n=1 Tax=Devosia subaequoris TaxID=395930 RepID=A0A7W6NDB0_9HYPH|nr:enoyl-CoA hydratase-related protein [Devosia subaequoris]MBB4053982.1 enoyl-CoA hydratase/carnithine racemase [Devosia subaequoris]MCP1211534.1 enoyl-CoA hydratase-related protein [Devosia subaequoris]